MLAAVKFWAFAPSAVERHARRRRVVRRVSCLGGDRSNIPEAPAAAAHCARRPPAGSTMPSRSLLGLAVYVLFIAWAHSGCSACRRLAERDGWRGLARYPTYGDVEAAARRLRGTRASHAGADLAHRRSRRWARIGVLQVRELPAHGRIQVSRRLQRAVAPRPAARDARGDRILLRQPCAGGGARGAHSRYRRDHRHARRRAGRRSSRRRGATAAGW